MYTSKGPKRLITWLPYLLILPSLVLFTMFCYYPFIKTIITSFSVTTETGEFIRWAGTLNWERVFGSSTFFTTVKNTFIFAVLSFVFSFPVGMLFAMLCTGKNKNGRRIYQTLYAVPMVISATVSASVWVFILRGEGGFLNSILGTEIAWLRNTDTAMLAVAFVSAWGHIAGRYLYLLVGFKNVPNELVEAAIIDGAGWWTRMLKIMIPMASPQIFYVLFLSIITAFKGFTTIKLLTGGGPAGSTNTLMYSVYTSAMYNGRMGNACCYALILFVIIFVATRIQFMFEKKMVHYQ